MRNTFDPTKEIALIWTIYDVQGVRPHLTDEQALHVLRNVDNHHDADHGVHWDTIKEWADTLYPAPAGCAVEVEND